MSFALPRATLRSTRTTSGLQRQRSLRSATRMTHAGDSGRLCRAAKNNEPDKLVAVLGRSAGASLPAEGRVAVPLEVLG